MERDEMVGGVRWGAALLWAGALGLVSAGLAQAMTVVTAFGGSTGTTFRPAAAVTVAVLLWRARREWPALLAAVWIAEFCLTFFVSHLPAGVSIGWAFANVAAPLAAAWLLTRRRPKAIDLADAGDLIRFAGFAVLVGPAIGALVGASSGRLAGVSAFFPALPRWFAGDAVGVLALGPAVLIALRGRTSSAAASRGTLVASMFVIAAASVLALAPWGVAWNGALPLVVVPLLALMALRAGMHGASYGVAIVAVAVNGMTAAGWGPFAHADESIGLIQAQAFVATAALTTLLVATLTGDVIARREAEEAKTAAVRTVAHDLRGPLGVIRGFVELLRDHGHQLSEEDKARALVRIDATADRLLKLVNDVLDLERVSGRLPAFQPVRLDETIQRLVRELADGDRTIDVRAAPMNVSVDPVTVERIVENLLANALRHTPEGTPILVRAEEADGGILLAVEDRGAGIADDEKRAIFEAFRRGKHTRVGTGVGLALVARFAALHGGRAWVEDRPGGGASFRVFLNASTRRATRSGRRDRTR